MLLAINNLSKSYTNAEGTAKRTVLDEINLELADNEKIAVLGPSGSGKTTLLNLIALLDHPDKGEIMFQAQNITGYNRKQVNAFRNQKIGFVFQEHRLLPQCSMWENVLIPTLVSHEPKKAIHQRAEELLKNLALWDLRHQKPGQLSGGECQRTAVARALINQPSLLLADEPTGSLDENNADSLTDLLVELNQQTSAGTAMIIVTHAESVARKTDKIYYLRNGQLNLKQKA